MSTDNINIDPLRLLNAFNAEGYDRSQTTRQWYGERLRPYFEFLATEGIRLKDSGPGEIKRYLGTLKDSGAKWSTRNGTYTALRAFYRWLATREHIQRDAFTIEIIKRPRKPRRIVEVIDLTYIEAMLQAAKYDDSTIARRDYPLMLLLFDCGVRRAESVSLKIADLDLIRGRVVIREGKGENQRVVYIEEPTRSALRNWLVVHPDPLPTAPLFVTMREGRQLAPRTVNGIISRWAKAADVPSHVSVSPHYWRRTFATNYTADGGDVFSLQEIMGHANIETTRLYIATSSQEWVQEQHRRHSPLNHLNLE